MDHGGFENEVGGSSLTPGGRPVLGESGGTFSGAGSVVVAVAAGGARVPMWRAWLRYLTNLFFFFF